ncbi:MAG: ferredoxin [Desulfurococcales archaeon ex4484_42]|nr:MAG: ferredoxin [Desulfurococcales archaeon ex4484_42]
MKENSEYPEIPLILTNEIGSEPVSHWRVLKPAINYDLCRKCWLCIMYCPEGVISKGDRGPVIDYRFCKGCGICANECPTKAISMIREV